MDVVFRLGVGVRYGLDRDETTQEWGQGYHNEVVAVRYGETSWQMPDDCKIETFSA